MKALQGLQENRASQTARFSEVSRLHASLAEFPPSDPPTESEQATLDALRLKYRDVFVLATEELKLSQQILTELQKACLKQERKKKKVEAPKQQSARSKKGDVWSHDNRILPAGTPVAALTDPHSRPPLWIIASVVRYLGAERKRPMYEVVDDDPGDESGPPVRKRYLLEPRRVICLPSLAAVPLSKRREFLKGDRVLAVFPGTTVLYPASVLGPPDQTTQAYPLMFDDDDSLRRDIDAGLVVPLPEDYGLAPDD